MRYESGQLWPLAITVGACAYVGSWVGEPLVDKSTYKPESLETYKFSVKHLNSCRPHFLVSSGFCFPSPFFLFLGEHNSLFSILLF